MSHKIRVMKLTWYRVVTGDDPFWRIIQFQDVTRQVESQDTSHKIESCLYVQSWYLWCDQAKSVGTRKYSFWVIANKGNNIFVSYCFCNYIAYIFGTNCLILMGFSAKCSLANDAYHQFKNENLFWFFRLILLDCITYLVRQQMQIVRLLWRLDPI